MNREIWLRSLALAVPVLMAMHDGEAWAQSERVGKVTSVQPAATIAPPGQQPAIVDINSAVSMADIVRTDIGGFVKIEFNDGSMLTVNPGSNVTIDKYVYNSSTNGGALVISVGSGVARFVSGNMRKEDIQIRTSSATMGLRGTDIVIRSDGVSSEIEVLEGAIALVPCGSKDVYLADKGQIIGVDFSCAISIGPAGVAAGATAAASVAAAASGPGPGNPGGGPGDPGDPGDPGGNTGGPGNGNGNQGNPGNGGGNTGGSGPGTGNGDTGGGNGGTGGNGAGSAGGGSGGAGSGGAGSGGAGGGGAGGGGAGGGGAGGGGAGGSGGAGGGAGGAGGGGAGAR